MCLLSSSFFNFFFKTSCIDLNMLGQILFMQPVLDLIAFALFLSNDLHLLERMESFLTLRKLLTACQKAIIRFFETAFCCKMFRQYLRM